MIKFWSGRLLAFLLALVLGSFGVAFFEFGPVEVQMDHDQQMTAGIVVTQPARETTSDKPPEIICAMYKDTTTGEMGCTCAPDGSSRTTRRGN